jgi:hypothetical protein
MNPSMAGQDLLSEQWARFEALRVRLNRYLEASEKEFGSLITALDECWNMAENVKKATIRLAENTEATGNRHEVLKESMVAGCEGFRTFMVQIQEVSGKIALAARETREVLGASNQLQDILAPLKHMAFHFRMEAARLPPGDSASILKVYEEMRDVVERMKQACDSQERTLGAILGKLALATGSVEHNFASFAVRAGQSEQSIQQNLGLLSEIPPDLLRVQKKASALETVLASGIREAVKALQGHDAIRQRLEHILDALGRVRSEPGEEPGHGLLLQRHQARSVLDLIVSTGSRIERELNAVADCAQGIAGEESERISGADEVTQFEKAADRVLSLSSEVDELLAGEVKIGRFVLAQLDPVRELMAANREELNALVLAMRSMKRLAFNVLISAEKMPSARAIAVLGTMTSESAGQVLQLEKELTNQFAHLGATLESQSAAITADVCQVESSRNELLNHLPDDAFRHSRRMQYGEVNRLSQEAGELTQKTKALVQSLKFVDEGTELFGNLDTTLGRLLDLYPKSDKPFDLDAAAAGYTMREQHDAHAMIAGQTIGGEAGKTHDRLTEPAEGQAWGDNVELF